MPFKLPAIIAPSKIFKWIALLQVCYFMFSNKFIHFSLILQYCMYTKAVQSRTNTQTKVSLLFGLGFICQIATAECSLLIKDEQFSPFTLAFAFLMPEPALFRGPTDRTRRMKDADRIRDP
jgi:hypothetical protein